MYIICRAQDRRPLLQNMKSIALTSASAAAKCSPPLPKTARSMRYTLAFLWSNGQVPPACVYSLNIRRSPLVAFWSIFYKFHGAPRQMDDAATPYHLSNVRASSSSFIGRIKRPSFSRSPQIHCNLCHSISHAYTARFFTTHITINGVWILSMREKTGLWRGGICDATMSKVEIVVSRNKSFGIWDWENEGGGEDSFLGLCLQTREINQIQSTINLLTGSGRPVHY